MILKTAWMRTARRLTLTVPMEFRSRKAPVHGGLVAGAVVGGVVGDDADPAAEITETNEDPEGCAWSAAFEVLCGAVTLRITK